MLSRWMNARQMRCWIVIVIVTVTFMVTRTDLLMAKVLREGTSFTDLMMKLNNEKVAYDNRALVNSIKKYYIHHPSSLPYNISRPQRRNPSPGQTQFIDSYLKQMRNGFFVDCGAFDGERLSNSLFLERYRNWTGILIEPNPDTYKSLISKHRKAHSVNACLSTKKYPSVETFFTGKNPVLGKVVNGRNEIKSNRSEQYIHVQCFPLYTILSAIGRLEVDFFSLDVEGAERGVLDTIPWNKVHIKTISIEHNKWLGGKYNLIRYMKTKGYTFLTQIKENSAPDLIFSRRKTNDFNDI